MKHYQLDIKVYSFEELKPKIQKKVLQEQIQYCLDNGFDPEIAESEAKDIITGCEFTADGQFFLIYEWAREQMCKS